MRCGAARRRWHRARHNLLPRDRRLRAPHTQGRPRRAGRHGLRPRRGVPRRPGHVLGHPRRGPAPRHAGRRHGGLRRALPAARRQPGQRVRRRGVVPAGRHPRPRGRRPPALRPGRNSPTTSAAWRTSSICWPGTVRASRTTTSGCWARSPTARARGSARRCCARCSRAPTSEASPPTWRRPRRGTGRSTSATASWSWTSCARRAARPCGPCGGDRSRIEATVSRGECRVREG
jgi:hypothetical protein